MRAHARGCASFWSWAAAGFLVAFSLVTGLSIGLFVAPVAIAAVVWVAWHTKARVEALGFVAGLGFLSLLIAAIGAVPPAPWLAAGIALAAFGVAGYWAARRSSS